MMSSAHIPVLGKQLVGCFDSFRGLCCDATYGRGGHSALFLETYPESKIIALDRDPEAEIAGKADKKRYGGRFDFLKARFGDMVKVMKSKGINQLDGIIFDLGVSSPQLDCAARGFSFMRTGKLDMRMGDQEKYDASWYVNHLDEFSLKSVFIRGGEDRFAGRLARAIVKKRQEKPIAETTELAEIMRQVLPFSSKHIDPVTTGFQAIRIHVNDELNELRKGLIAAEKLLVPGGKLGIIAFHSIEDRIVKRFLKRRSDKQPSPSRHQPIKNLVAPLPSFKTLTKKPLKASPEELKDNPRSRSAKLRAAVRTDAPCFQEEEA